MEKLVCKEGQCCGCSSCISICHKNAITIKDNMNELNAVINGQLCIGCDLCHNNCPMNREPEKMYPQRWYQGWSINNEIRSTSSSGGIARTISEVFINTGGIVCSCLFENGEFVFKTANSVAELNQFQGSKYVKSNPGTIYKEIKRLLKENRKVLFIGLPCQAQAVRNYVGKQLDKRLYTVDLICHGTPSFKLLELFLNEHNVNLKNVEKIIFRSNDGFGLKAGKKIESPGVMDRYSIAFLNSLSYTENCYTCKFASIERASDLTIGDCWGSELLEEAGKGVSLMLCQNEKGLELISNDSIVLMPVDLSKAIKKNPQLQKPCCIPKNRKKFFDEIRTGSTVDLAVLKCQMYKCFKQLIKKTLINMHLLKNHGGGYMISTIQRGEQ